MILCEGVRSTLLILRRIEISPIYQGWTNDRMVVFFCFVMVWFMVGCDTHITVVLMLCFVVLCYVVHGFISGGLCCTLAFLYCIVFTQYEKKMTM